MTTMKFRLTSEFGELSPVRNWQPHTGIDLAMPENTTLRSISDGVVEKIYDGSGSLGKGIAIKFDDGSQGIYGHMNKVNLDPGDTVDKGDIIGLSGNTGNSTGPHLHFSLKENGEFVDPAPVAESLAAISGNNPIFESQGVLTKIALKSTESVREEIKQKTIDTTLGILQGLQEVLLQLIDFIVLPGVVLLVMMKIVGMEKGYQWAGMLFMARILLKLLLGGY